MCCTEGERTKIAMFLLDLPWTLPFPNTPLAMEVPEYVRGNICNVWESMQWKFLESLCWAMGSRLLQDGAKTRLVVTDLCFPEAPSMEILIDYSGFWRHTHSKLFLNCWKIIYPRRNQSEVVMVFFFPTGNTVFTKQFLATLAKLGKVLLWEIQGQVKVYFIANCLLCIFSTDSFVIVK